MASIHWAVHVEYILSSLAVWSSALSLLMRLAGCLTQCGCQQLAFRMLTPTMALDQSSANKVISQASRLLERLGRREVGWAGKMANVSHRCLRSDLAFRPDAERTLSARILDIYMRCEYNRLVRYVTVQSARAATCRPAACGQVSAACRRVFGLLLLFRRSSAGVLPISASVHPYSAERPLGSTRTSTRFHPFRPHSTRSVARVLPFFYLFLTVPLPTAAIGRARFHPIPPLLPLACLLSATVRPREKGVSRASDEQR